MPVARVPSQARRARAFGARVRELRQAAGLTGAQVAGRIPMSGSTLSRIELGRTGPPADEVISRLATVLQASEIALLHLAGRAIDPDAFEQRMLVALARLVDEQRAGFDRIEVALRRLADDPAPP